MSPLPMTEITLIWQSQRRERLIRENNNSCCREKSKTRKCVGARNMLIRKKKALALAYFLVNSFLSHLGANN